MRKKIPLLLLVILAISGCDSGPEYHLRQLKYHGDKTKNGDKQAEHADALVGYGDKSVPLLIEEIRFFRYDQQRYSPSPVDLLSRIGEPAVARVRQTISSLSETDSDGANEGHEQQLVLLAALILISRDAEAVDQWLIQSEQFRDIDWKRVNGRTRFLFRLEDFLREVYPSAPPFLAEVTPTTNDPINREFRKWWKDSRPVAP